MSFRYSQDFKDSLVKLQQEGRSFKSLAEEFGLSKDSIAIWVKQATLVMTKGQSKTLKDVKQLEKRLAILEEEIEILSPMQKSYRKPKTVVIVNQKPNLIRYFHDLSSVLANRYCLYSVD